MASNNSLAANSAFVKRELGQATFRWTLNAFSTLATDKIVTESFQAPNSSIKWNLQIFPKGRESRYKDFVAVFVHPSGRHIEAAYSLGLLDVHNELRLSRRCQGLFEEGNGWGYANFFPRSQILDPESGLLLCDQLTMQCTLYYSELDIKRDYFDSMIKLSGLYEVCPPVDTLAAKFREMYAEGQATDITIRVGGDEVSAHRHILFKSPVFAAMFGHDMQEKTMSAVDIEDVDFETVKSMLDFLYKGTIGNRRLLPDLLQAADKYQLEQMKFFCQKELARDLDIDNAVELISLADKHNAHELKDFAMNVLVENINLVTKEVKEWNRSLSRNLLSEVIVKLSQLVTKAADCSDSNKLSHN